MDWREIFKGKGQNSCYAAISGDFLRFFVSIPCLLVLYKNQQTTGFNPPATIIHKTLPQKPFNMPHVLLEAVFRGKFYTTSQVPEPLPATFSRLYVPAWESFL